MSRQTKEPVNLRTGQWKRASLRNRNEEIERKQAEPRGTAGRQEVDQRALECPPAGILKTGLTLPRATLVTHAFQNVCECISVIISM